MNASTKDILTFIATVFGFAAVCGTIVWCWCRADRMLDKVLDAWHKSKEQ